MTIADLHHCDNCGGAFPIEQLDAKPRMTVWLFLVYLLRGQSRWLQYAADHGYDFDQLECRSCYGLDYVSGALNSEEQPL
jgi:hypothetical protein